MRNAQDRGWIVVAALSGAVSVMAGAFGAHGIDASTAAGARARELLQTGSHYEIAHALAILAVAALTRRAGLKEGLATAAQILFLAGSVLFPGALYALALGGPRWLGAVTPVGGSLMILGWLLLAFRAWRTA